MWLRSQRVCSNAKSLCGEVSPNSPLRVMRVWGKRHFTLLLAGGLLTERTVKGKASKDGIFSAARCSRLFSIFLQLCHVCSVSQQLSLVTNIAPGLVVGEKIPRRGHLKRAINIEILQGCTGYNVHSYCYSLHPPAKVPTRETCPAVVQLVSGPAIYTLAAFRLGCIQIGWSVKMNPKPPVTKLSDHLLLKAQHLQTCMSLAGT